MLGCKRGARSQRHEHLGVFEGELLTTATPLHHVVAAATLGSPGLGREQPPQLCTHEGVFDEEGVVTEGGLENDGNVAVDVAR